MLEFMLTIPGTPAAARTPQNKW